MVLVMLYAVVNILFFGVCGEAAVEAAGGGARVHAGGAVGAAGSVRDVGVGGGSGHHRDGEPGKRNPGSARYAGRSVHAGAGAGHRGGTAGAGGVQRTSGCNRSGELSYIQAKLTRKATFADRAVIHKTFRRAEKRVVFTPIRSLWQMNCVMNC